MLNCTFVRNDIDDTMIESMSAQTKSDEKAKMKSIGPDYREIHSHSVYIDNLTDLNPGECVNI